MTKFLNVCTKCGKTPQQIKKELGVDEVIFINGMCITCFKMQIDLGEIETYLEETKSKKQWRCKNGKKQ